MKHITFYLDFISPYAYLAFEQLPQALEGLTCSVDYRPVLWGLTPRDLGENRFVAHDAVCGVEFQAAGAGDGIRHKVIGIRGQVEHVTQPDA